jgi:hypothetical protein
MILHRMQDVTGRDPVASAVFTATARQTRKLLSSGVVLLRPEEAVLETALGCWIMQMESRNLTADYIEDSHRAVMRFHEYTNDYPWNWSAGDLESWSSELLAGRRARTVRGLQNQVGRFLSYMLDPVGLKYRIRRLICGFVVVSTGCLVFVDESPEDGLSVDAVFGEVGRGRWRGFGL